MEGIENGCSFALVSGSIKVPAEIILSLLEQILLFLLELLLNILIHSLNGIHLLFPFRFHSIFILFYSFRFLFILIFAKASLLPKKSPTACCYAP